MRARIFAEETRKWFTLAAVSFGLFMIMLDNTVVNVALPSIQRDLGTDLSSLQWIVTGYALTFAALMLIGGKVADAYGRRLIFVIGIAVFTSASLWCGLAGSGDELIAARVLQGAGAALMNPATLSIIAATFPPQQRGTAIGIWAGVSALALAIGPLVGGLITEHLDWSWIFFINIPVGIVAIAASFLFIDESRDETHVRLDLPGLATSAVGLFALTYGLIEANTYGWTSPRILGAFAVAGAVDPRVRPPRALPARADAPARALPQPDVRRSEPGHAARRARDVRRLLLPLAVHAERPRLLGRADGRRVPADDDPDHPHRTHRGEDERPLRIALAHDRGDDPDRGPAPLLLAARSGRVVLGSSARVPRRRRGDGAHDDAERSRGDAQRLRRQGRAWAPRS